MCRTCQVRLPGLGTGQIGQYLSELAQLCCVLLVISEKKEGNIKIEKSKKEQKKSRIKYPQNKGWREKTCIKKKMKHKKKLEKKGEKKYLKIDLFSCLYFCVMLYLCKALQYCI